MKNQNSQLVEQFVREMQLRNYSPRTIDTYSGLLSKVEHFFTLPPDKITAQQFKDYPIGKCIFERQKYAVDSEVISRPRASCGPLAVIVKKRHVRIIKQKISYLYSMKAIET